jgi:hypothetical protein
MQTCWCQTQMLSNHSDLQIRTMTGVITEICCVLISSTAKALPLMPCFLDGNTTPTIQHKYSKNKNSCFQAGCADEAAEDSRRGSNVYEVNTWLWLDVASLACQVA